MVSVGGDSVADSTVNQAKQSIRRSESITMEPIVSFTLEEVPESIAKLEDKLFSYLLDLEGLASGRQRQTMSGEVGFGVLKAIDDQTIQDRLHW